jgi:hypothetical protein
MPSIRDPGDCAALALVRREEGRAFWIDDAQPGGRTVQAQVPAEGGRGTSGSGADDDPGWYAVRFQGHLGQRRFGDVVVAPPVRGPLGIGELVEEVPVQLGGELGGDLGDGCRVLDEVASAALPLDQRDLGRAGRA